MHIVQQSATFPTPVATRVPWARWAVLVVGTAVGLAVLGAAVLGTALVLMSSLAG
ncbi:MAG: hypothetical protein ACT4OX_06175 [Actinomycetota bacterium]